VVIESIIKEKEILNVIPEDMLTMMKISLLLSETF
jgi:hypothetical protein